MTKECEILRKLINETFNEDGQIDMAIVVLVALIFGRQYNLPKDSIIKIINERVRGIEEEKKK